METIDSIPVTKIQRASKLVTTGAKVGVNYIKYYGNKLVKSEVAAREQFDTDNAEDIYNGLKQLKGSALKVAQMLSMDKSIMPQAYVEKFSLSQFSVPPLSAPLVNRTFKKYFGRSPHEVYHKFYPDSINAASIGQVHRAEKDGKQLAQYPGVSESISSDLKLVKPFALKLFNISAKDSDKYFSEVEHKLLEETDYLLELKQSQAISNACKHLPDLIFPKYYPELSSERILTMDWMTGTHLSEVKIGKKTGNKLGQALWDFYMYQIHVLGQVHADPHPGNFLLSEDEKLIVLDFGCVKQIPKSFYSPYFSLLNEETLNNKEKFEQILFQLEILRSNDSKEEISFFTDMFNQLFRLFSRPFNQMHFDFSDAGFFQELKMNTNRGSKHFIYVNRTFFGLYNLLHLLQANEIKINNHHWNNY